MRRDDVQRDELEDRDRAVVELAGQLRHSQDSLARVKADIAVMRQLRTWRYTALARRIYARLRRRSRRARPLSKPALRLESRGLFVYSIDAPAEGAMVGHDLFVDIHGWVHCEASPVARIAISLNGLDGGRARFGVARPDVAARLENAEAAISGFEARLDLRGQARASVVRVAVTAETLGGDRQELGSVEVKLPPVAERARENDDLPPTFGSARLPISAGEIRLLVFTHHLGLGGGQLYLFELLRLLSRAPNFHATVVAPADGPLRERTEALNIPVVVNGDHPRSSGEGYEARQTELAAWARAGGFNAVLANTVLAFPGVDLAARLGIPALWAIHESFDLPFFFEHTGAFDPVVRRRAEAAFSSAAAVIFEADATRELFTAYGDPRRFVTVPYGVDVDEIDAIAAAISPAEARRRLDLPLDATILLCLGTVEPRKNQTVLAEAFNAVAREHPDAMLVLVGAGSNRASAALSEYVRMRGIEDRVKIVSVTPDPHLWYRAADALVCASDIESLPRSALESMAFSVPVIATRIFGLPELIEDGVTGYLCEPRDLDALIAVLNRFLATGADERKTVGEAGAVRVRERHDSRGYAESYTRLLRAFLQDPSRLPEDVLT